MPLASLGAVAAAFDDAARLHVVNGAHHFLLDGGRWHGPQEGPACTTLMLAGENLACAFQARGKEVGNRGRWDWFALARTGAAIVFPWHFQSRGPVGMDGAHPDKNLDVYEMAPSVDKCGAVRALTSNVGIYSGDFLARGS